LKVSWAGKLSTNILALKTLHGTKALRALETPKLNQFLLFLDMQHVACELTLRT